MGWRTYSVRKPNKSDTPRRFSELRPPAADPSRYAYAGTAAFVWKLVWATDEYFSDAKIAWFKSYEAAEEYASKLAVDHVRILRG